MLERDNKRKEFSALLQLSVVVIAIMILAPGTAAAQDSTAVPQRAPGTSEIELERLVGGSSLRTTANAGGSQRTGEFNGSGARDAEKAARPVKIRRITLEQVK